MRIAINAKPKKAWGGGSHFVRAIVESLRCLGYEVVFNLKKKTDVIIVVFRSNNATFGYKEIIRHKKKNPRVVVIQRINNVDSHDQKGSIKQYRKYNEFADASIYVSEWAKRYLHKKKKLVLRNEHVVCNRVYSEFYQSLTKWNKQYPLRIVTHHWSRNLRKGFSFYRQLGRTIQSDKSLKEKFQLLHIGRHPFALPGIIVKRPLHGHRLAEKLSAQSVYLTASEMECGPYHVLEAINCGLPVLYGKNGGAVEEYVGGCGFAFEEKEIIRYLNMMIDSYDQYYDNVTKRIYDRNIKTLGKQYLKVINSVRKS